VVTSVVRLGISSISVLEIALQLGQVGEFGGLLGGETVEN
jgi:hypothetical protein